jgi:hypothetical protein
MDDSAQTNLTKRLVPDTVSNGVRLQHLAAHPAVTTSGFIFVCERDASS